MTLLKNIMGLCVAGALLSTTPGCNESDVAVGLAAVAVGVAAVAVHKNHKDHRDHRGHHRPRCRPGYRQECTSYYNYYGRRVTDCRDVYDRCLRYFNAENSVLESSAFLSGLGLDTEEQDSRVVQLAQNRGMSFEAAETLLSALDNASNGKPEGIFELGLATKDLIQLANNQLPTDQGIQALSQRLDIAPADTKKILSEVMEQMKLEVGDLESPFWTRCLASGRWQTPQNNRCEKTFWSGCSPETGATFCQAI